MKFYAISESAPNEIGVFESEAERDEWVAYEDWFSKEIMIEEDKQDRRMAITRRDAEFLVGEEWMDNEEDYEEDFSLRNIRWAYLPMDLDEIELLKLEFKEYPMKPY